MESPIYREVLQTLKEKSNTLFGQKIIFKRKDIALLLDCSRWTVWRRDYPFNKNGEITLEKLARELAK